LIRDDDMERCLLLCQMHRFLPGISYIYGKTDKVEEIVDVLIKEKNLIDLVRLCQMRNDPDTWLKVLAVVARQDNVPSDQLLLFLDGLSSNSGLAVLPVIEILSKSPTVPLGLVQPFLIDWLKKQRTQMSSDEAAISEHERQIAETTRAIENLQMTVQIFQMSKCRACDKPLSVPTVHFLCHHSYHQHCFESYTEGGQCPACKKSPSPAIARSGQQQQNFRNEMNQSDDCMTTLAAFFSNGFFSESIPTTPVTAVVKTNPFE